MNIEALFRQILKPALGCTEPVAVALATAAAYQASRGWTPRSADLPKEGSPERITSVHVSVSRSIFKNSFAISIPNSDGHKGLPMSAALGLFCDPRKGMRLFEGLHASAVRAAEEVVRTGRVQIDVAEIAPSEVFIQVGIEANGHSGGCVIRNEHSKIACLWCDGNVIHGSETAESGRDNATALDELKALGFAQVINLIEELPAPVLELLQETVEKNVSACKAGLERPMGIGTGYFGAGFDSNASIHYVSSLTAAGSDARMSGHPVEIMTSAGSGNQGIMATIPIVAYSRAHLMDESRMLKAVALSHLVTMYITTYVGYLSALCGVAIKAGIGAACGLTYLMGGKREQIDRAVKIMAATLTGMICDGAKAGCALKVSTAADMAMRAAMLAIRNAEVPDDNGIIAPTSEETIEHLAQLSRSMEPVDQKIIQIMLAKASAR